MTNMKGVTINVVRGELSLTATQEQARRLLGVLPNIERLIEIKAGGALDVTASEEEAVKFKIASVKYRNRSPILANLVWTASCCGFAASGYVDGKTLTVWIGLFGAFAAIRSLIDQVYFYRQTGF